MPIDLDGVDDALSIADHDALDWVAGKDFTIGVLVRIDPADLTLDNDTLVSTINNDSGNNRYRLRFRLNGTAADTTLSFNYRTAAEAASHDLPGVDCGRSIDWVWLTWEIERDGASTVARTRINGYIVREHTVPDPGVNPIGSAGLTIGALRVDNTPTFSNHVNCEVMHFAIWQRLLTFAEHENLYNFTAPHDLASTTDLALSIPLISDGSVAFPTVSPPTTTLRGSPSFSAAPTGPRESVAADAPAYTPAEKNARPTPTNAFDFDGDEVIEDFTSADFNPHPEPSLVLAIDGTRAMRVTGRRKLNGGLPSMMLMAPEFSPSIDLTSKVATLRYYIPPDSAASIRTIRIQFASGAGVTTNWNRYDFFSKNQQFGANGWHESHVCFDLPPTQTSGTPVLTAMRFMRVEIIGESTDADPLTPFDIATPGNDPPSFDRQWLDTDTIYLDSLRIYNTADLRGGKAAILVRMDDNDAFATDGGGTQYTNPKQITDIATTNSIPMHLGVVFSDPIFSGTPAARSWQRSDLLMAQEDGHLILNHLNTFGGANDWLFNAAATAARPASEAIADGMTARARARSLGVGKWADHVIVPGGFVGQNDHEIMASSIFEMLWYTNYDGKGGQQDNRYGAVAWPQTNLGSEQFDAFGSGTTQATVDAWIDDTVNNNLFGSFFFHPTNVRADAGGGGGGLFNWPDTVAKLKAAVDAGNLEIITIQDLGFEPTATGSRSRSRWRSRGRVMA